MFNRKQRIRALEQGLREANEHIEFLQGELEAAADSLRTGEATLRIRGMSVFELSRNLRQMDALILDMAKCPDWNSMRTIFAEAVSISTHRLKGEASCTTKPPQASQLAASPMRSSSTILEKLKNAPR